MKKKMFFLLCYFPIALLIFLNGSAFAQKVNASILFADAIINSNEFIIAEPDRGNNQFETFLVSNADQSLYASNIKANEDNQAFTDLNRKCYWKVINNKTDQNASVNTFPSESLPMTYNSLSVKTLSTLDSINQIKNKDYFLQLSKKRNTTGWVLLGCGTAMVIGGVIVAFSSNSWSSNSGEAIGYAAGGSLLILGGLIVDAVSIPFFITAHRHKKRAMSLSFGNQNIPFQSVKPNKFYSQAAFTLRVKL